MARVREGIAHRNSETTFAELEASVAQEEPARNLFAALTRPAKNNGRSALIAEIGANRNSLAIEDIAQRYYSAGAAALLCVTDESRTTPTPLADLRRARTAAPVPVIRDDLLIDPWQLWESRAAGADAVVIRAEVLREAELIDLLILAQQLHLTAIIEVDTMDGLLRARPHIGFPHPTYSLLCIKNRDTQTGQGGINHTLRLLDLADDPAVVVSRGGIRSAADVKRLRMEGVRMAVVDGGVTTQEPWAAFSQLARG